MSIKNEHEMVILLPRINVIHIRIYLDQATASISACALRYSSSLFARAPRRSAIAGSSFSNEDKRLVCKENMQAVNA